MGLSAAETSFRHEVCFIIQVMRRIAFIIAFLLGIFVSAQAVVYTDVSCQVAGILNDARKSPVVYAKNTLGIDEKRLKNLWGSWFLEDLSRGEAELQCDARLYRAAKKVAEGILQRLDLTYPNIYTLESLIQNEGFNPFMAGRAVSAFFFENFVPEDEALRVLLKHLLKNAFLKRNVQSEAVLYPLYRSVGAVLVSDSFEYEGEVYNGYLLVVLLGVEKGDVSGYIVAGWGYKPGYDSIFSLEDATNRSPVVFGDGSYYFKAKPGTYLLKENGNTFAFTLVKPVRLDFLP